MDVIIAELSECDCDNEKPIYKCLNQLLKKDLEELNDFSIELVPCICKLLHSSYSAEINFKALIVLIILRSLF
jgi:hypothetical protein